MTPMQKVDVLRAACCVAGIDGNIEGVEKDLLDKVAREVGVGRASLEAMMQRASTDPDFHEEQFRILKSEPQECIATVLEVAMADGSVSEPESEILRSLSGKLNVPDDVFDELLQKVTKML